MWSYLIQMATALSELHSKNILHRDIKPKNVFLTASNHVRVGDLGCAKLLKGGLAKTQIGTPYYMSPELWSKRPYDDKSDAWALGCVVYEMCVLQVRRRGRAAPRHPWGIRRPCARSHHSSQPTWMASPQRCSARSRHGFPSTTARTSRTL